jgi:hypothetical protein
MSRTLLAALATASVISASPALAAVSSTFAFVTVTPDGPGRWLFEQTGFDDGGVASGFFEGTDIDADGQLSSFRGEVSGFGMSWSGNSLVPAFALDFSALFGLVYDLDGGPLGDGLTMDVEGIGADDGVYFYLAGPGPIFECGDAGRCGIVGSITDVPAPAGLALFGLGLLGLGAATRRRS